MRRVGVALIAVTLILGGLASSGVAASSNPDFEVFKYWDSNGPYIWNARGTDLEARIDMDLDSFGTANDWKVSGSGVWDKRGSWDGGSVPLGDIDIDTMTVKLKYYEVSGADPISTGTGWSLKAQKSTGEWVGLDWLDRGTWANGHTQTFSIDESIIADLNSGDSKNLNLGVWYKNGDCHVKLAGIEASGTVVPEPGTIALMGMGIAGLAGVYRKRKNKKQ